MENVFSTPLCLKHTFMIYFQFNMNLLYNVKIKSFVAAMKKICSIGWKIMNFENNWLWSGKYCLMKFQGHFLSTPSCLKHPFVIYFQFGKGLLVICCVWPLWMIMHILAICYDFQKYTILYITKNSNKIAIMDHILISHVAAHHTIFYNFTIEELWCSIKTILISRKGYLFCLETQFLLLGTPPEGHL